MKQTLFAFLFLFTASALAAPIKVKWGGTTYNIAKPDEALWSQAEIAQSGVGDAGPFWPKMSSVGKQIHECAQMRVRGVAGDRTNRNYLVVCNKPHVSQEHGHGGIIKPRSVYLKRPDPFVSRPPLPMPPTFTQIKPLAKGFIAADVPIAQSPTYPPGAVVLNITRTNQIYWHVWAEHPVSERWAIQVSNALSPADWFTPPGYVDENGRVSVTIARSKATGHYFRAIKK